MARRSRNVAARAGFTLVELLVVISIIGMLAALLLPAVNSAREAGRRTVCLNNQKQLGTALVTYEQRNNKFPGYVNAQAINPSNKLATRPVGWVFPILPYLERGDVFEQYGSNAFKSGSLGTAFAYQAPPVFLKIANCPSDTRSEGKNAASLFESQTGLSYVVNCGLKDIDLPTKAPLTVARDLPQNGVFHFNYPYNFDNTSPTPPTVLKDFAPTANPSSEATASGEPATVTSTSFITGGDGSGTTLLLTENVDAGQWTGIWETSVGFVWQAGPNGAPGPCGLQKADNLQGQTLLRINERVGEIDQVQLTNPATEYPQKLIFGRPSSNHPGGVNATFVDSHTTFLADTMDYSVYCQLMSPRGKQSATNPSNADGSIVKFSSDNQYGPYYSSKTLNEKDF